MYIYSGYIECNGSYGDYEFESDEILNGIDQLQYLLNSGILQIVDNEPQEIDE